MKDDKPKIIIVSEKMWRPVNIHEVVIIPLEMDSKAMDYKILHYINEESVQKYECKGIGDCPICNMLEEEQKKHPDIEVLGLIPRNISIPEISEGRPCLIDKKPTWSRKTGKINVIKTIIKGGNNGPKTARSNGYCSGGL